MRSALVTAWCSALKVTLQECVCVMRSTLNAIKREGARVMRPALKVAIIICLVVTFLFFLLVAPVFAAAMIIGSAVVLRLAK